MPWETVGNCGSGNLPDDAAWIDYCYDITLRYLKLALGDPPEGCELDIEWPDYELGSYPSISVYWDFPADDAPWTYINRAETLLEKFNDSVKWYELQELLFQEDEEEDESDSDEEENEAECQDEVLSIQSDPPATTPSKERDSSYGANNKIVTRAGAEIARNFLKRRLKDL